jgi:hypothetical protein
MRFAYYACKIRTVTQYIGTTQTSYKQRNKHLLSH